MDGDRGTNYPSQKDFAPIGHCLFLNTGNVTKDGFNFSNCAFISPEKDAALRKGKLNREDVVLTTRGTVGNVAHFNDEVPYEHVRINSGMVILRAEQRQLSSHFLYLFVRSALFSEQVKALQSGSAQPQLPIRDMKQIEMPIPPLSEQAAICTTLGALDDRITLLRETNATLEAIAQALFKSWFVDFDPVRAKMEGRTPEGMDEATAALFPDGFETSELGEVPRGWRVGTLADLSDLNPESWTAKNHPDTVAYVDLANAKDNEIAAVTHFAFDDAPSRARRVLRDGDTIVGTVRPGNRSFAFIRNPASNLTGSTGFAVLRPLAIKSTEFVFLAATQDACIEHLAHVADGGAYPAVRPEVVSGLQHVMPDEQVLGAFHALAEPLLSKVAANQKQAQTLATLRDTLLPRLISGQLRLPEAQAELEACDVL